METVWQGNSDVNGSEVDIVNIYVPTEDEIKDSYIFDHCVNLGCERCDGAEEGYDFHEAEFNAWLAEHDREVSERVWEEGAKAEAFVIATSRDSFPTEVTAFNPYRKLDE